MVLVDPDSQKLHGSSCWVVQERIATLRLAACIGWGRVSGQTEGSQAVIWLRLVHHLKVCGLTQNASSNLPWWVLRFQNFHSSLLDEQVKSCSLDMEYFSDVYILNSGTMSTDIGMWLPFKVCTTARLLDNKTWAQNDDNEMVSWWVGWSCSSSASCCVTKDRCVPSFNNIFSSAVVALNETLTTAIFNKQILVQADKGEDVNVVSACLVEVV